MRGWRFFEDAEVGCIIEGFGGAGAGIVGDVSDGEKMEGLPKK